jgi:hypothetical protein
MSASLEIGAFPDHSLSAVSAVKQWCAVYTLLSGAKSFFVPLLVQILFSCANFRARMT